MAENFQMFKIAAKMFYRDWRRGDLMVLLFAMTIAMASISVIYLLINRIETATERQVADVLGADLVITSPQEIAPEWISKATQLQLSSTYSVEFPSVIFANEQLQLSSIKAVSSGYPLKGRIEIADTPEQQGVATRDIPPSGGIWVEPRIYNLLQLRKGSEVELGYSNLKIAGVIKLQPGQGSTLFNIAPSAIMNVDDLAKTQIIQPGSRIIYRYLFTGETTALRQFIEQIKPQLTTSQRMVTVFDESPIAGSAIERAKKYIGLSSLLTMVLLGVTIAMSASRFARRQFDTSALMRCFGLSNRQVLTIFIALLAIVCLVGIVFGSLIGILFQEILVAFIADQFVSGLPAANYAILFLPMLASAILLFGFSLPSLLQLKAVSPMRVLRRQLSPMGVQSWLVYLLSAATLVLVMWLQMGDLKLLFSVLSGLLLVILMFTLLASGVLRLSKVFAKSNSAAINFSLRQLEANKGITLLHLLAFSITIFVMALIILVRTELLAKWQQSLGEQIPNHFMVNVKPSEIGPLQTFFKENDLTLAGIYPMIRGRIVGINGEDIKTAVSAEGQQHNSLKRELNITWSTEIPVGNKIAAGEWQWQTENPISESTDNPQNKMKNQISIEENTALALGLKLGDVVDFMIGAEPWSATITSFRTIDWQTFTPNFYVIANPGSLAEFNATYISSFHMDSEKKPLLAQLVKKYPSVTVIELDQILKEIQQIISKVSSAIELIMIFVVAAGLGLLWAAMENTFDSKYRQSAILRTLGASKSFIAKSFRFEYVWMAILSSLMAILAVELVTYILYQQVFQITYQFHWIFWWALPAGALILMLSASWRGVKKVTDPSPLTLIRQE